MCLHLEIYLLLSILILNEVIQVDLIVFLALFADVATIAIAYDNARYAQRPVEWQLPKIWVISSILGILLAVGTWILRGTLFLNGGGVVENFGNPQGILFLEVALTENWLICEISLRFYASATRANSIFRQSLPVFKEDSAGHHSSLLVLS